MRYVVLTSIEDSDLIATEEGIEGSGKHSRDEVGQTVLPGLGLGRQGGVVWTCFTHFCILAPGERRGLEALGTGVEGLSRGN